MNSSSLRMSMTPRGVTPHISLGEIRCGENCSQMAPISLRVCKQKVKGDEVYGAIVLMAVCFLQGPSLFQKGSA